MYRVISECIDSVTGERKFPGDEFEPHSEEQAARLIAARCIIPVGGVVRATGTVAPPLPAPPPTPEEIPPPGETMVRGTRPPRSTKQNKKPR